MSRRDAEIGFSQRIRLQWFEHTARLILAGNDKADINDSLQVLLRERVSVGGASVRGNREKNHYHPVEDLAHRAPRSREAAG